jgi:glycine amidinotransferase/scyllo-inosamine-4-phosphate amidinotransferase 1
MLSNNEYGNLKTVIVGSATNARIPDLDKSLRTVNYADIKDTNLISNGLYPDIVIEQANEDLEIFCDFLKKLNINVLRPDDNYTPSYYNYCPRDIVLIADDLILASPNPIRARKNEYFALKNHLEKYKEITTIDITRNDELYNLNCIGDPDTLALTEVEPSFDAANILRDNDDLYYLVSNSGNKKGAEILQSLLPNKKVHTIENVYSYMHLDSTIAILREGLVLLNPSRITDIKQLPKPLQSYDHIFCPEPVEIGYYKNYCHSSKWINVNLFSINQNLVVLEEHQHNLRYELEKKGIDCAMLPMRHSRTLGGCFHCVTLDIERESN